MARAAIFLVVFKRPRKPGSASSRLYHHQPATLVFAHWFAPRLANLNALHQGVYYTLFVASIAWAIWRGTERAAPGLLWFTALCNALVPLAVVLTPDPDGVLLGTTCTALALFFGWLAWRQR